MNAPTLSPTIRNSHGYRRSPTSFRSTLQSELLQKQHDQLATALAHEIRNPLTNIDLSAKMLEASIKDNELKKYLDIIKRSSIRINSLVSDLLKYQQPDEAPTEKYSISELLDEVVQMTEDRLKLKNIVVKKEYSAEDCKITVNQTKMKLALTNIMINAIEAMDTEKGELKLVTRSIDDKYFIEIEDNGCGISPKNLKNIFTPYFTSKPGGLGIGLATTYNILRSNHVGINVRSEEGCGTRFILLFDK
jgi:signal transduction histidine kinase